MQSSHILILHQNNRTTKQMIHTYAYRSPSFFLEFYIMPNKSILLDNEELELNWAVATQIKFPPLLKNVWKLSNPQIHAPTIIIRPRNLQHLFWTHPLKLIFPPNSKIIFVLWVRSHWIVLFPMNLWSHSLV